MSGHGDALARNFRASVDDPRLAPLLNRTHGGDVDTWARSAGVEASDILDFSASINPLGPPRSALKAFVKSYREISRYPDPYGEKLKTALAERHGMSSSEVLLGNGSTQLIYLACAALRPRHAVIVGPAFSEYTNALLLAGATVQQFFLDTEDDFHLSLHKFMAAWDKDCDVVFLPTPNSVTGQLVPRVAIEKIAEAARARKCFVVIDEAFVDFVEVASAKSLVRQNPYLIVLRSLTKYYALPGLRLGYCLAEASTVARLAAYQEPWSVNAPALNVALACLKDACFAIKTERWLEKERGFLSHRLSALAGFSPFPSEANFLLVKTSLNGLNAVQLRSFLIAKGILIRACDSFAGLGTEYFRIAVKRRRDNLRLLAALRAGIASSKNGILR
ncbi:MAG TPA: threonine-phosphate decarboxylase CobD [Candidatus Binatia bacterium]|nr:threonine-phosphate decarboxylase CobD [Candidatus Binatia bacterium]